ncbi:hypothetical protein, partial [Leisingera sp. F5]|uniref:hypothetical protein n=1 Tax=Leisingera sp. F5 TaxID=1813816 RepID=UPI0025B9823E
LLRHLGGGRGRIDVQFRCRGHIGQQASGCARVNDRLPECCSTWTELWQTSAGIREFIRISRVFSEKADEKGGL